MLLKHCLRAALAQMVVVCLAIPTVAPNLERLERQELS